MQKNITIKHIAAKLKVSVSTVSRALRDEPDINADTKKKILALVHKWNYQPNRIAQGLRMKSTKTIGVLVPNLDYFFATAIKGIDEVAQENGFTVMVCQSNESYDQEVKNANRLFESGVDAFIVSVSEQTKNAGHFKRIQQSGRPIIFFDREVKGIETPKVVIDNFAGGYIATKHLIEQGCKRIAFVGGPRTLSISNKRFEGFLSALKDHGVARKDNLIVHGEFNREYAYLKTKQLLKHKPDGIFAMSDRIAVGCLLALQEAKLKIPDHVALIGFNNEPIVDLLTPSVSSIDQPAFKIGKRTAAMLFDILKNKSIEENIVIQPKLIIRASSMRL